MIEEQSRVDLSALDVSTDPERWRSVVDATLTRVDGVLAARPKDPLALIASWSRSLTAGAAIAVAILLPVELALELREADAERVQTLVHLTARTALGEQSPTGEELARALGPRLLP